MMNEEQHKHKMLWTFYSPSFQFDIRWWSTMSMTMDDKGWLGMTRDDQGILLCSKSMLDALFWCHRGWTEEMLSAGVSGRGAGYPCYIYTCQQKPAQCPLAVIVSTLSTGQTTDTQHAQNWIFSVSSHNHFLSGEGEDTTHIVWVCGQFMA